MQSNGTPTIVGKRYLLHRSIGAGNMGEVFEATDRLTARPVALKRVTPGPDPSVPADERTNFNMDLRLALAQEFKVLASLRHPHIISVLDYGFDENQQPYFTMEFLNDAQTLLVAGRDRPLEQQVALLHQVLQALAYLHRRGVLHRDLKPANVLVPPDADAVKLLDFGLAIFGVQLRNDGESLVGTLSYMAPEILLGEAYTPSADLYSLGIIACELMGGRHPFESDTGTIPIQSILNEPPNLTGVPESITPVLLKMLAKKPSARFASAADAMAALGSNTGITLSIETSETRESFLQAARLVGRDNEMAKLSEVLTESMAGRGSVWLIGGESGVGKSRLMDELRTLALVRGIPVARGQAVTHGATPYQLWRDVLRTLVLFTPLDALEASILKPLIPDLETLLEHPVTPAPEIEPQAAQLRLFSVVEAIFRRQEGGVAVLLEDLQWAGSESLALLNYLAGIAADLPLLLAGSYRDEEFATLPQTIQGAEVLKLNRFSDSDIIRLSEALLGSVGLRSNVVNLIKRESEGNVFFAVEVVRALAEEAGQLDRIGQVTLPDHILSGGIRQIIRRRLERVPASARPLLQIAAIIGRQVDLALMWAVSPEADLDTWLRVCANMAVLEIQDEHWRFTHDRLRDGLLEELTPDISCELHRRVAEAIEATYPDITALAATLYHHWAAACNLAKEAHYAALAGHQALQSGSFGDAIRYFERALTLQTGSQTPMQEAYLRRQLGEAYYGVGDLAQSMEQLNQALTLLGEPLPKTRVGLLATIVVEIMRQFAHRLFPGLWVGHGKDRERLLEANRAGMIQAEIAFFNNDSLVTLCTGFRAFNRAETAGISPELAKSYANMCIGIAGSPLRKMADTYRRLGREAAKQVNILTIEDFVLRRTAIYDIGLGRWHEVEAAMQRTSQLTQQHGNPFLHEENLNTLASMAFHHGEFARSKPLFAAEYQSTRRTKNRMHQCWGLLGQGENALRTGQFNEASMLLTAALDILQKDRLGDVITLIQAYGLLAATALRQGKYGIAFKHAEKNMEYIVRSAPSVYALLDGYAGTAEVYLTLVEEKRFATDLERRDYLKKAAQTCKKLAQLAVVAPIARPRALLYSGLLDYLDGKQAKAFKQWADGSAAAVTLDLPYERAALLDRISRHRDPNDPQRAAELAQAKELFLSLGATYDYARVASALNGEKLKTTTLTAPVVPS